MWWQQIQQSALSIWPNVLTAAVIFFGFLILRGFFTKYVFKLILRFVKKIAPDWDEQIFTAFERPLRVFIVMVGLYFALLSLPLSSAVNIVLARLFRSVAIMLLAWGAFNLTGPSAVWIEQLGRRYNFEVDRILIPFFSKVLRFGVVVIAVTVVAFEWDYRIDTLVAGLGLGGLAFALAAKDALGNLFGGIVIITEKPFSIGDWIETPSVEGTVEDISFRSTRIRTFAQALATIPNATLANEPITNWSRMGKRRITFHLGVTHDTPRAKMEVCVNRIRHMLQHHPGVHPETIFVHFDQFSESSLDIFLYFFTKTTDWGEWLKVKEDCNLRMMQILEEEGVEIAFPSRRVYVETE